MSANAALIEASRSAKELLSSVEAVEIPIEFDGLDHSKVGISRLEFEQLIEPSIDDSIALLRRTLDSAGVLSGDLDSVVLIGSSTHIPVVRRKLVDFLSDGVEVLETIPKLGLAQGAALAAHSAASRITDVTALDGEAPPVSSVSASASASASAPTAAEPLDASVSTTSDPSLTSDPVRHTGVDADAATTFGPSPSRRKIPVRLFALAPLIALTGVIALLLLTRTTTVDVPATPTDAATAETDGAAPSTSTPVDVAAFFIDVHEVTNAQYSSFITVAGAPVPLAWNREQFPTDQESHPVRGIPWDCARAYCLALGKRLPIAAEWEAASRGPDGHLYPGGTAAADLDLDTGRYVAVGSVAANISVFGVRDSIGSVWEWVDEPYVEVEGGQQVRRGGEYGRVRSGLAMRQTVDPLIDSTIRETGFRCAATEADAGLVAGDFEIHAAPSSSDSDQSVNAASNSSALDDDFEDTTSGWFEKGVDGEYSFGYRAPSFYRMTASQPDTQVMSLPGLKYQDGSIETAVFVEDVSSTKPGVRYGLVFRAQGDAEDPSSQWGNPRPLTYYALVQRLLPRWVGHGRATHRRLLQVPGRGVCRLGRGA